MTTQKCDECGGKGEIELFTSWADCEKCGGTGELVGQDESKQAKLNSILQESGKILRSIDNPCAEVPMWEPVASSFPVPPEKETTVPLMAGDQKIGEITNVHTTINEPGMMEVSFTLHVDKLQHKLLEDVADIEEVSLRVNDNKDAFPVIQGHRHVEKNSSLGCRVKDECVICQKKECKHLGFDEDKFDRDAEVVSSHKSVAPKQKLVRLGHERPELRRHLTPGSKITDRSSGIEPPLLDETYRRTYGIDTGRTRLFRDGMAKAEQRIMRQMLRGLGIINEEDDDE